MNTPVSRTTLAIALIAMTLSACSKITVENYNKIQVGMKYDEIKQLLGTPTKCSDVLTVKTCVWGDDKHYVQVSFVADQVLLFNSENIR
jgi:hypothetical protein